MSHPFPSALLTKIHSQAHKEARLVKIVMQDASTIAMTDWDKPLIANIDGAGALTYLPTRMSDLSAFALQINTAIDDTELTLLLDNAEFYADGIRNGIFDGAQALVALVDPTDLSTPGLHRRYDIGQVKVDGAALVFELMGPEKRLEQAMGRVLTNSCPWHFTSVECGIAGSVSTWAATTAYAVGAEIKPTAGGLGWFRATVAGTSGGTEPTWPGSGTVVDGGVTWKFFHARLVTGTVTAVSSKRVFSASGINIAIDYFGEGRLIWLTGGQVGQRRAIRADDGAGVLTLHIPMFDLPQVGDTFSALVGCRHRRVEDCVGKHNNAEASSSRTLRFGGFDFLAPEQVTVTANK